MKKKVKTVRSRKLEIQNSSNRTMEEKGFDDMAAITLGDDRKVYKFESTDNSEDRSDSFYDLIQKEDREKRLNRFIIGLVAVIGIIAIVCLRMLIEHHNEQIDGKIRVNYSSSDLEGTNYEDVVSKLEKQGFTNIETESIEDLITGWITNDGEVEEVEIDGTTSFSSGSRFRPNTEIVIRYHTFPSD